VTGVLSLVSPSLGVPLFCAVKLIKFMGLWTDHEQVSVNSYFVLLLLG